MKKDLLKMMSQRITLTMKLLILILTKKQKTLNKKQIKKTTKVRIKVKQKPC